MIHHEVVTTEKIPFRYRVAGVFVLLFLGYILLLGWGRPAARENEA
ncbi:MAG TPA: hypothetical protein VH682_05440 [Gemmataceae bacterium]|jgi:hypothetical protein